MEKKIQNEVVETSAEELIKEYNEQVAAEGKPTYLVSVYDDYSDSTCC